jgi:flagellar assembly factor FliW
MHIESTRFGTIEIRDDALIDFPDGLIGLTGRRYALLVQSEDSPFHWLHSADDPGLALPVTNPWLFFADYDIRVSDEDVRQLGLGAPEEADIFCVVRAGEQLEDFMVNLAAPIVIHAAKAIGRQILNDAHGYAVRQHLFAEVELADVRPAAPVSVAAVPG